jgi:hypothetical protein
MLECILTPSRDLAYIEAAAPHQSYVCATPPSADSHICPLLPLYPDYINSAVEALSTKVQADGTNQADQAAVTDPKSAEKRKESGNDTVEDHRL